ncbi:MAG: hypothetical protein R2750_08655 [Bacteroidales bacterium]
MKTLKTGFLLISLMAILIVPSGVFSQDKVIKIEANEKILVVDSIAKFMTEKYVFPDKGKEMGDLVLKNLKDGKYDDISDPNEFADKLSEDLLTINNDRHIGVRFMPERIAMIKKADEDENNKELEEYEKKQREYTNYFFKE